jgi:hypothetical protein
MCVLACVGMTACVKTSGSDLTPGELADITGVNWWKFALNAKQRQNYESVVIGIRCQDGSCSNILTANLSGFAEGGAAEVVASIQQLPDSKDIVAYLRVTYANRAGEVGRKVLPASFRGNSVSETVCSCVLQELPIKKRPLMTDNDLSLTKEGSNVLYLELRPKPKGEPRDAPRQ